MYQALVYCLEFGLHSFPTAIEMTCLKPQEHTFDASVASEFGFHLKGKNGRFHSYLFDQQDEDDEDSVIAVIKREIAQNNATEMSKNVRKCCQMRKIEGNPFAFITAGFVIHPLSELFRCLPSSSSSLWCCNTSTPYETLSSLPVSLSFVTPFVSKVTQQQPESSPKTQSNSTLSNSLKLSTPPKVTQPSLNQTSSHSSSSMTPELEETKSPLFCCSESTPTSVPSLDPSPLTQSNSSFNNNSLAPSIQPKVSQTSSPNQTSSQTPSPHSCRYWTPSELEERKSSLPRSVPIPSSSCSLIVGSCAKEAEMKLRANRLLRTFGVLPHPNICLSKEALREHFWFGTEDAQHVEVIFSFYLKELQIPTRTAHSRAPEQFIGCIERRLVQICSLSSSSAGSCCKPVPPTCCEEDDDNFSTSQSCFVTMDLVHIFQRELKAVGGKMKYIRSKCLLTEWECSDGLPRSLEKINDNDDAEEWERDAINFSEDMANNSNSSVFFCSNSLYCEPIFGEPEAYSYSSQQPKRRSGKYYHSPYALSPGSSSSSSQSSDSDSSSSGSSSSGSSSSRKSSVTTEPDVVQDLTLVWPPHPRHAADGTVLKKVLFSEQFPSEKDHPEIGYSVSVNSCIAYSMPLLLPADSHTMLTQEVDDGTCHFVDSDDDEDSGDEWSDEEDSGDEEDLDMLFSEPPALMTTSQFQDHHNNDQQQQLQQQDHLDFGFSAPLTIGDSSLQIQHETSISPPSSYQHSAPINIMCRNSYHESTEDDLLAINIGDVDRDRDEGRLDFEGFIFSLDDAPTESSSDTFSF